MPPLVNNSARSGFFNVADEIVDEDGSVYPALASAKGDASVSLYGD
jgi:hypothetical protein